MRRLLRRAAPLALLAGIAPAVTVPAAGLALVAAFAPSCASLDTRIEVASIRGPLARVLARVGAYAAADPSLGPAERASLQAASQALQELLARERLVAGELELAGLGEVTAAHDAWVAADPALDELERRIYLGDSEVVLDVARAARGDP